MGRLGQILPWGDLPRSTDSFFAPAAGNVPVAPVGPLPQRANQQSIGSPFGVPTLPYRGKQYPLNVQNRLFPPNTFNYCLDVERQVWQRINDCGGLQAICPGRKWPDPPWVKMPVQGKRFSKISSISLPNADGADHLVLSWLVPYAFDGCIVSVVQIYTGQGFQEGSGDLTWRLKLNQHYVKDYGATTTSIGSLTTPYNINSGQVILQSGQLVQYFVNRSTGSGGNLNGGRVICATFGWFWPR